MATTIPCKVYGSDNTLTPEEEAEMNCLLYGRGSYIPTINNYSQPFNLIDHSKTLSGEDMTIKMEYGPGIGICEGHIIHSTSSEECSITIPKALAVEKYYIIGIFYVPDANTYATGSLPEDSYDVDYGLGLFFGFIGPYSSIAEAENDMEHKRNRLSSYSISQADLVDIYETAGRLLTRAEEPAIPYKPGDLWYDGTTLYECTTTAAYDAHQTDILENTPRVEIAEADVAVLYNDIFVSNKEYMADWEEISGYTTPYFLPIEVLEKTAPETYELSEYHNRSKLNPRLYDDLVPIGTVICLHNNLLPTSFQPEYTTWMPIHTVTGDDWGVATFWIRSA